MKATRWNLFVLVDTVDSTNDLAFELLTPGRTVVVMARKMERGRGRAGHTWVAPPGGLWISLGFPTMEVEEALRLSFFAPLAVVEALQNHGLSPRIRIPNDVYLEGRKVAGILVERRNGQTVLGIGLNVSNPLPPALQERAISLADAGVVLPPLHLAYDLLAATSRLLEHLDSTRLLEAWKNALDTPRKFRGYAGGTPVEGELVEVLSPHALRVRWQDGREEDIPAPLLHDLEWWD